MTYSGIDLYYHENNRMVQQLVMRYAEVQIFTIGPFY